MTPDRPKLPSIRSKLLAIVLVATVLPLAAGFSVVMFDTIRGFRGEMVDSTVLIARVTAENSISDLAFGDREAAASTLAKLASVPDIRKAVLFDNKGALFSQWPNVKGPAIPAPRPGLRDFTVSELHVAERVIYQGEPYGTIYLEVGTSALQKKVRDRLFVLLVLMCVVVLTASLLAMRLEKIVSGPILSLAAVARQISADHDYSVRVLRSSDDEVGILADGFNEMLTQIERRQHERDEAVSRTREKSQFLANMSHELRTPLNAIIGFSEILQTRLATTVGEREHKFLNNINSSGQHLLGIVNDILDLSKIEAGRMEITPELFSMEAAIQSVCSLMRGVSGQRRISFEVEVDPTLPAVEADLVKVKQILYNLLSNATKFSPDGSVVRIHANRTNGHTTVSGDAVRVSVEDQGIGIDPENHKRIFLEFQQVESSDLRRQFGGTGLGLTLVKRFVEMHGGVVELESARGRGSTFTVVIPLVFRGEKPESPVTLGAPSEGHPRILVIEDDASAYQAIERQLRSAGYSPVWARTGEEGITLAREAHPAAITLDLMLPGIDGIEVLKQLKSERATRNIPVIIVSVSDNRELGMAFGARDYFVKPVDQDQLLASLRRILEQASGKLLVVDDDKELHDVLDLRLKKYGYSIVHAYGAVEGFARASTEAPSLVILDLMMQDMNGFALAARLNRDPRTAALPILAVTNNELTGGDRQRLKGKITALVEKGELSGAGLVSVIREAMDGA